MVVSRLGKPNGAVQNAGESPRCVQAGEIRTAAGKLTWSGTPYFLDFFSAQQKPGNCPERARKTQLQINFSKAPGAQVDPPRGAGENTKRSIPRPELHSVSRWAKPENVDFQQDPR